MCGAVSTNQIAFALFQSFTSSGFAPVQLAESCFWIGNVTTSVSLPGGLHRLRRISSQCLYSQISQSLFDSRRPDLRRRAADEDKRMHIRRYSYRLFAWWRSAVRYRSTGGCSTGGGPASPPDQFAVRAIGRATPLLPASHRPVSPDPAPGYHAQYQQTNFSGVILMAPYRKTQAG